MKILDWVLNGILQVPTTILNKVLGPRKTTHSQPQRFYCANCGAPRADVALAVLEKPAACLKGCGWQMVATKDPEGWKAIGAEVKVTSDQRLGGTVVWFRPTTDVKEAT